MATLIGKDERRYFIADRGRVLAGARRLEARHHAFDDVGKAGRKPLRLACELRQTVGERRIRLLAALGAEFQCFGERHFTQCTNSSCRAPETSAGDQSLTRKMLTSAAAVGDNRRPNTVCT